ncbi:MAG: hypothetical protein M2R45_03092 [Verrucomicrobia subdivision 3 bacterium]|nr:hypothetical protein [Limisphaerales bacterium]MCS1416577.1 hypothetical protein [Limisphaerales bacterium]
MAKTEQGNTKPLRKQAGVISTGELCRIQNLLETVQELALGDAISRNMVH